MAEDVRMALAALRRKAKAEPGLDVLRAGMRVLAQALMEVEVEHHPVTRTRRPIFTLDGTSTPCPPRDLPTRAFWVLPFPPSSPYATP